MLETRVYSTISDSELAIVCFTLSVAGYLRLTFLFLFKGDIAANLLQDETLEEKQVFGLKHHRAKQQCVCRQCEIFFQMQFCQILEIRITTGRFFFSTCTSESNVNGRKHLEQSDIGEIC